jgi:hypothetical protein
MGITQNSGITEKTAEEQATEQRHDAARARKLANLKPFRKGTSGNPGGRPVAASAEVRALAQEGTPNAFGKIVELMDSDDPRIALMACKEILERAFGKPGPADTTDGETPRVQVNIIRYGDGVAPCN